MRLIVTILAICGWFAVCGPTYTVYPNHDGELYKIDGTINGACAGAGASVASPAPNAYVGEYFTGIVYHVNKIYLQFILSAIPVGETITGVTFSLYCVSEGDELYTGVFLYRIPDYMPTLNADDWLQPEAVYANDQKATNIAAGQYINFGDNSLWNGALTGVAPGDTIAVWLITEGQCNAPAPTNDQRVRFRMSELTGLTQDPKLTIITTAAPSGKAAYGPRVTLQPTINGLVRWIEGL